jgi:hypothetical protein
MTRMTQRHPAGWHSEHRRDPDGAITSAQWVVAPREAVPPGEEGARRMSAAYWRAVESTMLGVVRACHEASGAVELRVAGRGPALLRFGAPSYRAEGTAATAVYPIAGGLLARRPAGELTFSATDLGAGEVELRSTITGYYPTLAARPDAPRWTGELYQRGQARMHARVSKRYFADLIRGAR